jgi:hypothetical protein
MTLKSVAERVIKILRWGVNVSTAAYKKIYNCLLRIKVLWRPSLQFECVLTGLVSSPNSESGFSVRGRYFEHCGTHFKLLKCYVINYWRGNCSNLFLIEIYAHALVMKSESTTPSLRHIAVYTILKQFYPPCSPNFPPLTFWHRNFFKFFSTPCI